MTGLTIPFTGLKKQYNNLRQEILDVTDEVLRSGNLMNGNWTAEFENWLCKKNSRKHAVCVHSGTSALEIIAGYYASEKFLGSDSPTVLIPSLTYAATANAFIRAGWQVVFIDTDNHGILDARKIPDDLNYQAVVLVGLYGASIAHMADIKTWRNWVLKNKIIIEDAAQHWLAADSVRIGNSAALSFDPMKNLSCYGNGGAIVTNDQELYYYALAARDNGKPDHVYAGTNSRMSEIDCAQMMVKTRYIDQWQQRRRAISDYWRERLLDRSKDIRCLITEDNAHDHAHHKFVIDISDRDTLHRDLATRRIETRIHYKRPLHETGIFRAYPGPDILSASSALSRRVLSLPLYPELTDLEVEYVADQVLESVISSG